MQFDPNRYKIYTWKSPFGFFWALFPVTFLTELIGGVRKPALLLIDKTMEGPEFTRTIVPCPHCGKLHDARTWSPLFGTQVKNWFGLYCPNCRNVIPCMISISSMLVLALTFPLWIWFREPLRKRWLRAQPARFENLEEEHRADPYGERWELSNSLWVIGTLFVLYCLLALIQGDLSWSRVVISLFGTAAMVFCLDLGRGPTRTD